MKKLVIAGLMAGAALAGPAVAHAGAATDAALALGAFAVFNQIVRGDTVLHAGWGPPPAVVHHAPPPVVYGPRHGWAPYPYPHRHPGYVYPHWKHGRHAYWNAWDKGYGHGHGPRRPHR